MNEKTIAHECIAKIIGQPVSEVLRSWVEGQIFPSRMRHILLSYGWNMSHTVREIKTVPTDKTGLIFSQLEGFRKRKWTVVDGSLIQLEATWIHQFFEVSKNPVKFTINEQSTIPGVFLSNENNDFHIGKESEVKNDAEVIEALPAFDLDAPSSNG